MFCWLCFSYEDTLEKNESPRPPIRQLVDKHRCRQPVWPKSRLRLAEQNDRARSFGMVLIYLWF